MALCRAPALRRLAGAASPVMNVPSLGHVRLVIVAARKWSADTPRVYIFWPAYIYPVEPRKEPNFGYRPVAQNPPRVSPAIPQSGASSG